jgi:DNA-binding LytR/AlgR family response regulator
MNIKFIKDPTIEENILELRARENNNEIISIIETFQNGSFKTVNLYDNYNVYCVSYKDILKFYSDNGEVFAITDKKIMRVKKKLYEIQESCSDTFIKINNHEIINVNKIDHFDLSKSGFIFVDLVDGSRAKVSRRRVKDIKKFLGI